MKWPKPQLEVSNTNHRSSMRFPSIHGLFIFSELNAREEERYMARLIFS